MTLRLLWIATVLFCAGCATTPSEPASALTVIVPTPVVADPSGGSFTLIPTVAFKNPKSVRLRIVRIGGEISNARLDFDVFDAAGNRLTPLKTKPVFFYGGGRHMTVILQPGDQWNWRSTSAETYTGSAGQTYHLVAHLHLGNDDFASAPISFPVEPAPHPPATSK